MNSKLFLEVYDTYWLYAKQSLKKQSYESQKYKSDKHIKPYFKDYYLDNITSEDILKWKEYVLSFGFKNNQNKSLYYTLSAIFEFCSKHYNFNKKIISNVGCFKTKYEENNSDFYNLNEFKKFIKYVENNIYKQFFNLMFYTGTRPGEAMALKFSDLKNGYIHITKTISSHNNREIGTPKNKSSIRKIKIDKILERDLLELKKQYIREYKEDKDYYIFGGIKPISPTTINRYKIKACEKANLRKITLHQFRHSHATLLLNNGMIINEISRRLGHSKVSTTLDIYAHTDLTQEKRVENTLNYLRSNPFFKLKLLIKRVLEYLLKPKKF